MSRCEQTLGPGVAAYQTLSNAGKLCDLAPFDATISAMCKASSGEIRNTLMQEADDKVLCAMLCCCNKNPLASDDGKKNAYQKCVESTLAGIEQAMGNNSRFKPEVSYNMRANPPEPLMGKDECGDLTTCSLKFPGEYGRMRGRINRDFPNEEAFEDKDTRRPDVIIVNDPSKPPTQDNINRVVEMKFGNDPYGRKQSESYDSISAHKTTLLDAKTCGCDDEQRTKEQVALVMAAKEVEETQVSTMSRVLSGVGAVVAGIATVGAALVPFDGPAGEIALGSLTARLAARAAASTALSTTARTALARNAAQAWERLYQTSPAF